MLNKKQKENPGQNKTTAPLVETENSTMSVTKKSNKSSGLVEDCGEHNASNKTNSKKKSKKRIREVIDLTGIETVIISNSNNDNSEIDEDDFTEFHVEDVTSRRWNNEKQTWEYLTTWSGSKVKTWEGRENFLDSDVVNDLVLNFDNVHVPKKED